MAKDIIEKIDGTWYNEIGEEVFEGFLVEVKRSDVGPSLNQSVGRRYSLEVLHEDGGILDGQWRRYYASDDLAKAHDWCERGFTLYANEGEVYGYNKRIVDEQQ